MGLSSPVSSKKRMLTGLASSRSSDRHDPRAEKGTYQCAQHGTTESLSSPIPLTHLLLEF